MWYIADHHSDDQILRGPFAHSETAAAVRTEMEHNASEEQNERWNLWVIYKPVTDEAEADLTDSEES